MLDLDALCSKSFPVRLNGRELRVLCPTAGMVRRMLALSDCPDEELIDRQIRLAEEILGRNEERIPIGRTDLETLSPSALGALISRAASLAMETSADRD